MCYVCFWLITHLEQDTIRWVRKPDSHRFPKAISSIYHASHENIIRVAKKKNRKIIEINIFGSLLWGPWGTITKIKINIKACTQWSIIKMFYACSIFSLAFKLSSSLFFFCAFVKIKNYTSRPSLFFLCPSFLIWRLLTNHRKDENIYYYFSCACVTRINFNFNASR